MTPNPLVVLQQAEAPRWRKVAQKRSSAKPEVQHQKALTQIQKRKKKRNQTV